MLSTYSNYGGMAFINKEPHPAIKTDNPSIHKHILFPLKRLIEHWVTQASSPNAYRFGLDANGTIEVTIEDSASPHAYETEWSSIEVLLYLPEEDRDMDPEVADFCEVFEGEHGKEKKFLAFRFHQRAIVTKTEDFLLGRVPPSDIALELVKGAKKILRLSNKVTNLEGNDINSNIPFTEFDNIFVSPNFLIE